MSISKIRHPVKPGDVLHLRGQGLHFSSKGGRIKAEALVDNKVAAEAEIDSYLSTKVKFRI